MDPLKFSDLPIEVQTIAAKLLSEKIKLHSDSGQQKPLEKMARDLRRAFLALYSELPIALIDPQENAVGSETHSAILNVEEVVMGLDSLLDAGMINMSDYHARLGEYHLNLSAFFAEGCTSESIDQRNA